MGKNSEKVIYISCHGILIKKKGSPVTLLEGSPKATELHCYQWFFCTAGWQPTVGQQPAVGQGAEAISWDVQVARSLKCPSLAPAVDLRASSVSSTDSCDPLPFSVQWREPLWGHEPSRHLWELRDGFPHAVPGVHRWQLERDHEGNWASVAWVSLLWGRRNSDLFSSALVGKGREAQELSC